MSISFKQTCNISVHLDTWFEYWSFVVHALSVHKWNKVFEHLQERWFPADGHDCLTERPRTNAYLSYSDKISLTCRLYNICSWNSSRNITLITAFILQHNGHRTNYVSLSRALSSSAVGSQSGFEWSRYESERFNFPLKHFPTDAWESLRNGVGRTLRQKVLRANVNLAGEALFWCQVRLCFLLKWTPCGRLALWLLC